MKDKSYWYPQIHLKINQKIITRVLTVLIARAILQLEQRRRNKRETENE